MQELIDRLKKRLTEDRQYRDNNTVMRDLLEPQLKLFDARKGEHNTFAVRQHIEYRNAAKRATQYAIDLEEAIGILERVRDAAKSN